MPKIAPLAQGVKPYWTTSDGNTVCLYLGNVTDVLAQLPEKSVQCCVTSPPYWGLRDYGTGTWEGGDPACDHVKGFSRGVAATGAKGTTLNSPGQPALVYFKVSCEKCGAVRIDQQIGSEPSPDCGTHGQAQCGKCFVCSMVAVFRGVRRVLRDDGVLWLNLGDTYASGEVGRHDQLQNEGLASGRAGVVSKAGQGTECKKSHKSGLPSGNLVGIPWRVALALQADGWVLRSDMPWIKRSPMPESVKNRPAKALEYVFLFSKKMGYFYDGEAIKKVATPGERVTTAKSGSSGQAAGKGVKPSGNGIPGSVMKTGDRRNFWQADLWFESVDAPHGLTRVGEEIVGVDVTSQGYEGSHFATFPPKLIEPMIKAGTSEKGCCAKCGAPWRRVTEETKLKRERPNDYVKRSGGEGTGNSCANSVAGVDVKTLGWETTCGCGAPVIPCTVLDPFIGSGTTCCVSLGLGRRSWGIDLSEVYLKNNAIPRVEGCLVNRPSLSHLAGKQVKPLNIGKA